EVAHQPAQPEPWRRIGIDDPPGTLALPRHPPLDLTGAARAFAADRAAEAAAAQAGCGVLVSLGQHVAAAGPVPDGGWPIRLDHDHDLSLQQPGGLATTSVAAPPRTWRAISVLAGSCVDAMIAARAAL